MQTICTWLQTDNGTNTPSLNFYRPDALLASNSVKAPHYGESNAIGRVCLSVHSSVSTLAEATEAKKMTFDIDFLHVYQ